MTPGATHMITDPSILRIRRNFLRPSPEIVAALTRAATGHLVDPWVAAARSTGRSSRLAMPPRFCGIAITCDAGPGRQSCRIWRLGSGQARRCHYCSDGRPPGCRLIGDLIVGMARNCGVAAFVTDGTVRDVAGLLAVGPPSLLRRRFAKLPGPKRPRHSWPANRRRRGCSGVRRYSGG